MKGTQQDRIVLFCGFGMIAAACFFLKGTSSMLVGVLGIAVCCYKWYACFGTKEERRGEKKAEKQQHQEAIKAASTPVKAKIIDASQHKKAGSTAVRSAIGGTIAGVPGLIFGAVSGKNTTTITFLVTFKDGHKSAETVKEKSSRYYELMKVCED